MKTIYSLKNNSTLIPHVMFCQRLLFGLAILGACQHPLEKEQLAEPSIDRELVDSLISHNAEIHSENGEVVFVSSLGFRSNTLTPTNASQTLLQFIKGNLGEFSVKDTADFMEFQLLDSMALDGDNEQINLHSENPNNQILPKIKAFTFSQTHDGVESIDKLTALVYNKNIFSLTGKVWSKSDFNSKVKNTVKSSFMDVRRASQFLQNNDSLASKELQISNGVFNKVFFANGRTVRAFVCKSGDIQVMDAQTGELAWIQNENSFCRQAPTSRPTRLLSLRRSEDPFWFNPISPSSGGLPMPTWMDSFRTLGTINGRRFHPSSYHRFHHHQY